MNKVLLVIVFVVWGIPGHAALASKGSKKMADVNQIQALVKQHDAKLAFVFKILSIQPTFPVDDMPNGLGLWHLKAQLIEVAVGTIEEKPQQVFEANVPILWTFGSERITESAKALWVNGAPRIGSQWIAVFSTSSGSAQQLLAEPVQPFQLVEKN